MSSAAIDIGEPDYATAVEILREALARIRRERDEQALYCEEKADELAYGRAMLAQAEIAEAAILRLLGDAAFITAGEMPPVIAEAPQVEAAAPERLIPETPAEFIDWTEVGALWSPVHWEAAYRARWPVETASVAAQPVAELEPPRKAPRSPPLPAGSSSAADQAARALVALTELCAATGEVQISLGVLSAKSGVPKGSMLFALRRLVEDGKIEMRADPTKQVPSTYRVVGLMPEVVREPEPAPVAALRQPKSGPISSYVAPLVTPPDPPASGRMLRERILHTLRDAPASAPNLAILTDAKELAVAEALRAMETEGAVAAGPIPTQGARHRHWQLPERVSA